jgi:hypothetical protein
MSASNEWTEWHLTPRGWERGTEKLDFSGISEVSPPPDRVLTVRWCFYLGYSLGKPDQYHEEVWHSSDQNLIDILKKRFGEPPKSL